MALPGDLRRALREELKASRSYNRFGFRPPRGVERRIEVTALIPYGDYLWVATRPYGGIYTVDESFELRLRYEYPGYRDTWGRAYHEETDKAIIGRYVIEGEEVVELPPSDTGRHYTAAACRCPPTIGDPDRHMIVADYGGRLARVNMETYEVVELAGTPEGRAHPQELAAIGNYVIVPGADWKEYGLWKYDGAALTKVFDEPHITVYTGGYEANPWCFALGFDALSAILSATPDGDTWYRYRLPRCWPHREIEHVWCRTRQVEGLGVLMDVLGQFMLLCPQRTNLWGAGLPFIVAPVSRHIGDVHDFCSFNSLLAVARYGACYVHARREYTYGTPWSGLDFYRLEDIWSFGKPMGFGGVWKDTSVDADQYSDPFLVYGFERKTIHLWTDTAGDFTIEVDPVGDGSWKVYDTVSLGAGEYTAYIMTGDAVWVRFKFSAAAKVGAWLVLG